MPLSDLIASKGLSAFPPWCLFNIIHASSPDKYTKIDFYSRRAVESYLYARVFRFARSMNKRNYAQSRAFGQDPDLSSFPFLEQKLGEACSSNFFDSSLVLDAGRRDRFPDGCGLINTSCLADICHIRRTTLQSLITGRLCFADAIRFACAGVKEVPGIARGMIGRKGTARGTRRIL